MIRAILFDIHDTLITKDRAGVELAQDRILAYLTERGYRFDRSLYVNAWVKALKAVAEDAGLNEIDQSSLWKSVLSEAGIDGADKQLIDRLNDEWVAPFRQLTTPLPNAAIVVERLRQQYLIAAVSNSFARNTMIDLEVAGLSGLFHYVVTSSDVGKRKPHPLPFLRATELLGVAPDECIFVGNDPIEDIYGAKMVGMKAILLRSESGTTAARRFGKEAATSDVLAVPDCIVGDLGDLDGAIKEIRGHQASSPSQLE